MIQREENTDAPAQSAAPGAPTQPQAATGEAADMRNVKRLVDEIIATLGPLATTVIPVPDDVVNAGGNAAVASATPTPSPSTSVATTPAATVARAPVRAAIPGTAANVLARDTPATGGAHGAVHPEGGVVASLQACYDLMTGRFRIIGWVWAGAGIHSPLGWYGAYGFIEGTIFETDFGNLLTPGQCNTTCDPQGEEHRLHGGGGVAGFPIVVVPGQRARFSKGGLEIGLLFTPNFGNCSADLELIGLIDVKRYLGPAGAIAQAAEDTANRLGAEFGQRVECGAGFDLSVTAHLCKAADPSSGILGYTTNSIALCGGGFVGCAINLSRSRAALPGGGH